MTTKNVWEIGAEDPDDLQLLIQAERRRDRDKGSDSVTYVAARSATERWIAQTFAELLGVDRVGVDDDFFALGGHSLLATQVIARVRGTFRLDAPLEWILEAPTVERLARRIDGARENGALLLSEEEPLPSCTAAPAARHEPFPLTAIQQAYWMGRNPAFELGNISTHVYLEYETSERLDVATLERAWQRLVERHDMLRAVIEPDGLQRVLKEVPAYRIALLDLDIDGFRSGDGAREDSWRDVSPRLRDGALAFVRYPGHAAPGRQDAHALRYRHSHRRRRQFDGALS